MSRVQVLVGYLVMLIAFGLALSIFGHCQREIARRDLRIEELTVQRDSAELRYQRAKLAVVHDTVVVRQAVAGWQKQSAVARKDVEAGITLPPAQVIEILDAGDSLASKCAQFLTHTETLVQSADTLNLAAKAEIHALGKRKPSKIGQLAKAAVHVLAGVGLGAILF